MVKSRHEQQIVREHREKKVQETSTFRQTPFLGAAKKSN